MGFKDIVILIENYMKKQIIVVPKIKTIIPQIDSQKVVSKIAAPQINSQKDQRISKFNKLIQNLNVFVTENIKQDYRDIQKKKKKPDPEVELDLINMNYMLLTFVLGVTMKPKTTTVAASIFQLN